MNIDSIKNYPTGIMLKHKPKYGLESRHKSTGVDLCEMKNVNKDYFSGSFTGLNGAAAKTSNTLLDKLNNLCNKHTVIAQNLVALVLAGVFRPIAIMSLPGKKNKKDKQYASGHSIASGLIGFGFASIIMYPLGKAVSKIKKSVEEASKNPTKYLSDKAKEIYKVTNLKDLENSRTFENVTRILDMALDVFVFGVLKARLTIALIPPILYYGFGLEKSKKPEAKPSEPAKVDNNNTMPPGMSKPEIAKFAGGLK